MVSLNITNKIKTFIANKIINNKSELRTTINPGVKLLLDNQITDKSNSQSNNLLPESLELTHKTDHLKWFTNLMLDLLKCSTREINQLEFLVLEKERLD